jgi:RNA polymerase sigma-32 factor
MDRVARRRVRRTASNLKNKASRGWHWECKRPGWHLTAARPGVHFGRTRARGGIVTEVTMPSLFEVASLKAYRENLSACTRLSREDERSLAERWIAGDGRAGEQIVEACLPFVISIAREYRRWGVPLEDVIQQGNVGLLRAAKKFDPTRECRLATYAAYWIRAEIREYVVRGYRIVRLGTTKGERRALRAYRITRETDPQKLAEVSGMDPARVAMLLPLLAAKEMSLDATVGDMPPAIDRMASHGPSPEEEAGANEVRDHAAVAVKSALRVLTERERFIVRERMMKDEPLTLQALGDMLGVSKERVRQLEERAREKLREQLEDFRASA